MQLEGKSCQRIRFQFIDGINDVFDKIWAFPKFLETKVCLIFMEPILLINTAYNNASMTTINCQCLVKKSRSSFTQHTGDVNPVFVPKDSIVIIRRLPEIKYFTNCSCFPGKKHNRSYNFNFHWKILQNPYPCFISLKG